MSINWIELADSIGETADSGKWQNPKSSYGGFVDSSGWRGRSGISFSRPLIDVTMILTVSARHPERRKRSMNRLLLLLATLIGSALLSCVQPAEAQYPPPRSPYFSSSRFSPWLELYRRDPGVLGAYLSHVRPRQELQSILGQQALSLQRQQASVRSLQGQVYRLEQAGSLRPTGTGSVFMNYSHYYPALGFGGGRR